MARDGRHAGMAGADSGKGEAPMAMKPNYNFEKRQREMAKKKKQDEKRLKKQQAKGDAKGTSSDPSSPANANGTGS
jgi:hypothetical protein